MNGVAAIGCESCHGPLAGHANLGVFGAKFGGAHAIWGTCAGAIFLSKDTGRTQPLLQLMDITVKRNAFGRQVDSFETDLDVPCLGFENGDHNDVRPFHAVFIRAPLIEAVHGDTQVLSRLPDGRIVAAQQGRWLATSSTKSERSRSCARPSSGRTRRPICSAE